MVQQIDLGTSNRCTRRGIDHHHARILVWQRLPDKRQPRDVKHLVLGGNRTVAGHSLDHIAADGQSGDDSGIRRNLVGRLTVIFQRECLHRCALHRAPKRGDTTLNFIKVLVTRLCEPIDIERNLVDIAYRVDAYRTCLTRTKHAAAETDIKGGIGYLALHVAQTIHPGPSAPLAQRIVDIMVEVTLLGIGSDLKTAGVEDGQFACLLQVLILIDERIDTLQLFRLLRPYRLLQIQFSIPFYGCRNTGSPTVAVCAVILVQQAIGTALHTDDMQQVVAEDAAVHTLDDQRFHTAPRLLGQSIGMLHRQVVTLLALRLVDSILQRHCTVASTQRSIIHGLEGLFAHSFGQFIQFFSLNRQRIWRYRRHGRHAAQLCLDQMAVRFFGGRLGDNLIEYVYLTLRQVFVHCRFPLFPQRCVIIGFEHGREPYKGSHQGNDDSSHNSKFVDVFIGQS